ncbi:hypothetical protein GCM10027162_70610 [Streptomyces incanus]
MPRQATFALWRPPALAVIDLPDPHAFGHAIVPAVLDRIKSPGSASPNRRRAWRTDTGGDLRFPEAPGRRPLGSGLVARRLAGRARPVRANGF